MLQAWFLIVRALPYAELLGAEHQYRRQINASCYMDERSQNRVT